MYLDFYQLKEKPFPISSELKYFFPSSTHQAALKALSQGVSERRGLTAVLGEFGLGKTTLIKAFSAEAGLDHVRIITVLNSHISLEELLLVLCRELGEPGEKEERSGLSNRFIKGLRAAQQAGTVVVLVIDEAHNMPEETLEGLRLIFDTAAPLEKSFQIVFCGEPVFWEMLGHHDLRPLKQRIGTVIRLSPLTAAEGRAYIGLRMERAGGRVEDVFTRGALDMIVRRAGGIPAKINVLGSNALAAGQGKAEKPISAATVREAAAGPLGAGRGHYRPWALSATGGLVVLLAGWLALDRLAYFSPKPGSRIPPAAQAPAGPTTPGNTGEERPVPSSRGINPVEEKSPLPSPAIISELEIPLAAPRSEAKPPAVKETLAPVETNAKTQGPPRPISKKPPIRTVRTVKAGNNFYRMVLEVYGFSNKALLEQVRKSNPAIRDVTRLRIGEKIVFPEWKEGKPR